MAPIFLIVLSSFLWISLRCISVIDAVGSDPRKSRRWLNLSIRNTCIFVVLLFMSDRSRFCCLIIHRTPVFLPISVIILESVVVFTLPLCSLNDVRQGLSSSRAFPFGLETLCRLPQGWVYKASPESLPRAPMFACCGISHSLVLFPPHPTLMARIRVQCPLFHHCRIIPQSLIPTFIPHSLSLCGSLLLRQFAELPNYVPAFPLPSHRLSIWFHPSLTIA